MTTHCASTHCYSPKLFSLAWHGETVKRPPTPPRGLAVHAVHILHLHPSDPMVCVPSG